MRRALLVSLAAVAVAIGAAACGSSANTSSSTTAGAGAAVPAPTDAQLQARVELAKCLRANGIDVPDSVANGGATAQAALRQLVSQYGITKLLQLAETDCKSSVVAAFPALSLSPAQLAQRQQQALKFVECLRAHGINVPDPAASGARVGIVKALSNIDVNSPAFIKANNACASLRPARLAGG
jgi:hypothetical protein